MVEINDFPDDEPPDSKFFQKSIYYPPPPLSLGQTKVWDSEIDLKRLILPLFWPNSATSEKEENKKICDEMFQKVKSRILFDTVSCVRTADELKFRYLTQNARTDPDVFLGP